MIEEKTIHLSKATAREVKDLMTKSGFPGTEKEFLEYMINDFIRLAKMQLAQAEASTRLVKLPGEIPPPSRSMADGRYVGRR
jgi:hypothetical protein